MYTGRIKYLLAPLFPLNVNAKEIYSE